MTTTTDRKPAIVWGRGPTAVGILRCLHIAKIPTFVASPPNDAVARSRFYRPIPGANPWQGALDAGAREALRRLPFDEAVVIPSADDTALWLSDIPASDLARQVRVSTSSRAALEILHDKTKFAEFLRGTDIPHPRTFMIESAKDIAAVPYEELDSTFLKPANSQKFSDVTGIKALRVASSDELSRIWTDLAGRGFTLMAQEYVPGPPTNHYFVDGFRDGQGRITGLFARRRIRMHPADFGNSSYCRSIPLDEIPEAVDSIVELVSRLGYRGIFSAEFKRDARDGKFRIIEVNARAWTYVEFAARCGVNVCAMAYEDALDRPVAMAPKAYAVGQGCVDFRRDMSALRTGAAGDALPKILLQWAFAHFHTFRLDDPGPGLFAARQIFSERQQRRAQKASPAAAQ
jgi:predicted ATP-grasp superfamily ATP-dependent carboligase